MVVGLRPIDGAFDGDTASTSREATIREVSGDSSVALENLGSARRVTDLWAVPLVPLRSARLVVGVKGGATGRCFLVGVLGAEGSGSGAVFLFRLFSFGGIEADFVAVFAASAASWVLALLLMRADRRVAAIAANEYVLKVGGERFSRATPSVSGLYTAARDFA